MSFGRAPGSLALAIAAFFAQSCASGDAGDASLASGPAENAVTHNVTEADVAATESTAPIAADSATLYVNGLGCPLCASNIDKQLARVKGVESVTVDLSNGKVGVGFKPGGARPSPALLGEAVEDAGFTLVKVETGAGGAR